MPSGRRRPRRPSRAVGVVARRPAASHDADGAPRFEEDLVDRGLLADNRARVFGVAEEQLVEVRALDLIGHRVTVVPRVLEDHRARAAGGLVPEESSVLLLETGGPDLLGQAEFLA